MAELSLLFCITVVLLFRKIEGGREPISVSNLPGDYNPAYCQPPFCNPFTHTFGIGIMHQESKNFEIDGLLDFPVPTGSSGQGMRFPLSGNGYFGPFPASLFYGHHVHPVNPFPRLGQDWLAKAKLLTRYFKPLTHTNKESSALESRTE
ncbi:Structural polyprotein [Trichinella spiralis]|uniref:Structural polyprotein n=1 Tax=Trichinella spiralis TaxID=6334 RepID=A0ABR3KEF0_TRISP